MMKKIIFAIMASIVFLAACQKEELATPKEDKSSNIKIFFGEQGYKSGGININNGDTIDLYRSMPTIFWAYEDNEPLKVYWQVQQTLSDDPPHIFAEGHASFEDMMAYIPTDPGYYSFKIFPYPNGEIALSFWAYVSAPQPGKIGDGIENDFIFRMEKKSYPDQSEKLFLYFKYSNDYNEEEVGATLGGWPPGGLVNVELSEYKFAKTSYSDSPYFYLILEITPGISNYAAGITFWALEEGVPIVDENNYFSSWYTDWGQIQFYVK